MKTPIKKLNKFLHGGDYNPDQWLDCPEILKQDIELMKKAHVNCVSLGIFSWATLEPEEGNYQFDWLEEIINNLYKEEIYTILATPTAGMPKWLTEKYEEVRQVRENGVRNLSGGRHNFCYTSPIMREKARAIDTALAKKFGNHPGVILWHISNEMGGNGNDASCHCPLCQAAFREWLKNKYKTLDSLNHAWWTKFWSHTYTSWDQIHSPVSNGVKSLHGLELDWRRFITAQTVDFYKKECEAVKEYSKNIPVTTNMMEFFTPLDYFKFKDSVDIVSWDSYTSWHESKDDVDLAIRTAASHNIMRAIKKQAFLLMESTPSLTNWKHINTLKRPKMHMLSSMQAVAHGSNSVQYFQWRKSRGASEKFHGAVIDHYGKDDTRVFKDVTELGIRLESLTEMIYKTINKPKVAIIFDWENMWAMNDAQGPNNIGMKYIDTILNHYKPFWEMGIDVDIIDMEQEIDNYKLVIAPMTYMMKEQFGERVKEFVSNGGCFVSSYWSGIVNETDLCFLGGFPGIIGDVVGIRSEEIDAINEYYPNSILYKNKSYEVKDLCDLIHLQSAKAEGYYEKDFYRGMPALTRNKYGKGIAYYIAARASEEFNKDFYSDLVNEIGVEKNINGNLPYGVTVTKRCGEDSDFLFVQNFNSKTVLINLDREYEIAEDGISVSDKLELKSYDCVILKDKKDII
ncbi:beta-galactosidase [Clostridium chromiireducens]|uniref:Beta-galactosidase n=2 Tax=Clostridium chromiireducens TaxID=225345 RepID=A0A399IKH4_9CLOT|nr:beta-galactosidase [Clostridium chromiireducens]RII33027.1 beta-galactosidase [Clostridium chromiireducens]